MSEQQVQIDAKALFQTISHLLQIGAFPGKLSKVVAEVLMACEQIVADQEAKEALQTQMDAYGAKE